MWKTLKFIYWLMMSLLFLFLLWREKKINELKPIGVIGQNVLMKTALQLDK